MNHFYSNIMVMGAGAVGGYFGGRIAERTDRNVALIARGKHHDALRENGLSIKSIDGDAVVRTAVFEDAREAPPPDLVLFTVKSYDTAAAIKELEAAIQEHTQVLTLQNGIENYSKLARAFGGERVIQGLCRIGAEITEPGRVVHTAMGEITAGELDGKATGRVKALEELFADAGVRFSPAEDIAHEVWVKFAWNCVFNMPTAAAEVPVDALFRVPAAEKLCYGIFEEVRAVAAEEGVNLDERDKRRIIEPARKLEGFITSTLQDRQKGKKLEYDAFTGALLRLADKHALNIPHVSTLHAMLELID